MASDPIYWDAQSLHGRAQLCNSIITVGHVLSWPCYELAML